MKASTGVRSQASFSAGTAGRTGFLKDHHVCACVFVVAGDPVAVAARWAHFSALLPRPAGAYVHLAAMRGHVLVGSRENWIALLGDAPSPPALAGYAIECRDAAPLVSRCKALGLPLRRIRDGLYAVALPEALGGNWIFGTRKGLALPS